MISQGKYAFFPPALMPRNDIKSSGLTSSPDAKIRGKPSQTVMKSNLSLSQMFASTMKKKDFDVNSPAILHDRALKLSFRGLDDISKRLAQNLAKIMRETEGLKPNEDGDTVIAFLLNDDEIDEKVISLILAAAKLGVTYTVLSTSGNPSELLWILKTVQPVILITEPTSLNSGTLKTLEEVEASMDMAMVHLHDLWVNAKVDNIAVDKSLSLMDVSDPEYWSDSPMNERTVAIFFTAGFTGSPHGVRIGFRQIHNRLHWQQKVFPMVGSDSNCLTSSPSDPRSICQIFTPLLAGRPLTLVNKADVQNPTSLFEKISESKLTRMTVSPTEFEVIVNAMLQTPKYRGMVSTMTHWIVSGDKFNYQVGRKFFEMFSGAYRSGIYLINMYGTTEVLGEATFEVLFNAKDLDEKMSLGSFGISVGVPISNTSVAIVDKRDKNLPIGRRGEIVFSGACLSDGGYVGQGSGTRAKFNVNKLPQTTKDRVHMEFRTGDIGRILVDKNGVRRLYVDGRSDNELKVGGLSVNLRTLSAMVMNTGLVHDTQIMSYHRGRESQVIIAACLIKKGVTVFEVTKRIREAAKEPNTLIPEVFSVEEFPLLHNGRVNLKELRATYRNCLINCEDSKWKAVHLAPKKLQTAKIFCKAVALSLGIPLSFIVANFDSSYWDMGGSALNAIMTIKICLNNGLSIAVEDFASAESLSQIVERIELSKDNIKSDAWLLDTDFVGKFSYDLMSLNDEDDVIRLLKDDCIPDGMSYSVDVIKYWKALIDNVRHNNLCVVAKDAGRRVVGVAINGEAEVKMKFPKTPREIAYGLELLGSCQEASRSQMWSKSKGRVAQTFFLAIKSLGMSPGDSIVVAQQLMIRTCLAAQSSQFSSVVVTTSNPLVQDTCTSLLNFKNVLEFPVARFKAKDKSRPFTYADDHHTASVLMKDISWEGQEQQNNGSGLVSKVSSRPSVTSPPSVFKIAYFN